MKKVIFAVAIVATMGLFTSCNKEKCWEITTTAGAVTVKTYYWCTADEADKKVENLTTGISTATKKHVNKAESECKN